MRIPTSPDCGRQVLGTLYFVLFSTFCTRCSVFDINLMTYFVLLTSYLVHGTLYFLLFSKFFIQRSTFYINQETRAESQEIRHMLLSLVASFMPSRPLSSLQHSALSVQHSIFFWFRTSYFVFPSPFYQIYFV